MNAGGSAGSARPVPFATVSLIAFIAFMPGTAAAAEEGAEVGKISLLDGTGPAVRKPDEGRAPPQPLKIGTAIRVGDQVETGPGVRLKLTLNDRSVLMLDEKSTLRIDAAEFGDQTKQRNGFWATLGVGRLWAKVAKAVAGSDAKFEVRTERAVAGVRGTRFWVDAVEITKRGDATTEPKQRTQRTRVQVSEGIVAVQSTAPVKRQAPKPQSNARPGPKGRTQVPGPQEISKDQWERRFLELQRGMVVTVDDELWTEAVDAAEPDDAFARFVRARANEETGEE